ncbi:MAG TPA: hypothetical protein VIN10_05400 [Bacteroidales bacterium]
MKTLKKIKYFLVIIITVIAMNSFAQGGPGDPGGDPEGGGDPLGGRAPLSGGTFLLIALGAAYGSKKIIEFKNISKQEDFK